MDCEINWISSNEPLNEPVNCEVVDTLILADVFWTNVGNTLNPLLIILITFPNEELIDAVSEFVPILELITCGVDVILILAEVFNTMGSNEPVPPLITLTTYPNDELIEDVKSELIDEPVVWVVLVTLIKPSTDAVSGGIEPTPPSIIEFTRSNPSLIVVNSFGWTYDEVVWEPVVTLNGLSIPQFNPLFWAIAELIAPIPLLMICSIIANEELIADDSTLVPPNDSVTLLRPVTLINLSSFVIIRGVSNIMFWTIDSPITFEYRNPSLVSLLWVVVATDGNW